jgi:uncharacterized coiled-coil protein SlyX
LLGKLDDARMNGRFGEAEIALLREKLSVVVTAYASERAKREFDFEKLASAARVELSEREYALSAAKLELVEARSLVKILEAREEATRDDLDEALTGNEILRARLSEEHECAEALRREAGKLREALKEAGEALAIAAEEEERRASESLKRDSAVDIAKEATANARIARLEEKVDEAREENKKLRAKLDAIEGENSELNRAVAERDGAQTFLKTQLADWNQRFYARATGAVAGDVSLESESAGGASTSDSSELRARLDAVEIELGAKTGAVRALERRVKEQDKSLSRARAEIERMREQLAQREDEMFERQLASGAPTRKAERSKYVEDAEHAAAEVMETLRATREKHAKEKRGRDARAARRGGSGARAAPAVGRERREKRGAAAAPPRSVAIDASAPYQPPVADDDDDDDDDEEADSDSEYDEVEVPIKRRREPKSAKKPQAVPAKENENAESVPANDGPRMPLGMIQMPKLGAKKDKNADDGAQKKRRLNRQSAIPEALPNLLFGVGDVAPAQ